MKNYPNPMNLGIKSLKTWRTDDGGGWQFILTADGTPIIEVHNDGNGGPVSFGPVHKDGVAPTDAQRNTATTWLRKINAFAATLPPETDYGVTITINDEIYVESLMAEHEMNAKLKRAQKKNTTFRLISDGESVGFRSLNVLDRAQAVAYLDKHVGAGKYVILPTVAA